MAISQGSGDPERFSHEGTPVENIGLAFIGNIIEWQQAIKEGNAEKARVHQDAIEGLGQKLEREFGINPEHYLDEVRAALERFDKLQEGSVASLA